MSTNLVCVCSRLRVGKCVVNGQQPLHSMHIKSGVNSFLPTFEILAKEDLNPEDVWKGLRVGRRTGTSSAVAIVGTTTDGWRVAVEGTFVGGAVVAPTTEAEAWVVAFVSMSKSVKQIPKIVKDAPCRRSKKDNDSNRKCEQEQEPEDRWMTGSGQMSCL